MGKDFKKSALPIFLHFVRVRAVDQPHMSLKGETSKKWACKNFEKLSKTLHTSERFKPQLHWSCNVAPAPGQLLQSQLYSLMLQILLTSQKLTPKIMRTSLMKWQQSKCNLKILMQQLKLMVCKNLLKSCLLEIKLIWCQSVKSGGHIRSCFSKRNMKISSSNV